MRRTFLKSKIHRARVTQVDAEYEGSLRLDGKLMREAGMLPFERIEVYDVANGERFSTYLVKEEEGSGKVAVYGAAALKTGVGHPIIVAT